MRYIGGKKLAIGGIIEALQEHKATGPFWEPFCGGLGASVALSKAFGPGRHSDINTSLIAMYCAIQDGWLPPTNVSRNEYATAKSLSDLDPLKAFCGFGCSFAGKWFGGYAKDGTRNRNFAQETRTSLLRDVPQITRPFSTSFFDEPITNEVRFIYCDPPYEGVLSYSGAPKFDFARFWDRVVQWSKMCDVYVSEYTAPEYATCIHSAMKTTTVGRGAKRSCEKLFYVQQGSVIQ